MIKTNTVLRKIVNSDYKIHQVSDRVRYLIKSSSPKDPLHLPEVKPSERTSQYVSGPPSSDEPSCQSGRLEWTDEETRAIEDALSTLQKPPRNTELRTIFSASPVLRQILLENTFERVWNKVKNVFYRRLHK